MTRLFETLEVCIFIGVLIGAGVAIDHDQWFTAIGCAISGMAVFKAFGETE